MRFLCNFSEQDFPPVMWVANTLHLSALLQPLCQLSEPIVAHESKHFPTPKVICF